MTQPPVVLWPQEIVYAPDYSYRHFKFALYNTTTKEPDLVNAPSFYSPTYNMDYLMRTGVFITLRVLKMLQLESLTPFLCTKHLYKTNI